MAELEREKNADKERMRQWEEQEKAKEARRLADLEAMKKHKKTLYPNAKDVNRRFKLAEKYFKFLGERTKVKPDSERYKMVFKIN